MSVVDHWRACLWQGSMKQQVGADGSDSGYSIDGTLSIFAILSKLRGRIIFRNTQKNASPSAVHSTDATDAAEREIRMKYAGIVL